MEIWKPVPSLPEYEASSLGRMMRVPYTAPMPGGGVRTYGGKPRLGVWSKDQKRYILVFRRKTYRVARLICEAFHGPCPEGMTDVMHMDEAPANNRPENLQWGTRKENLNMPQVKAYHSDVCRQKMTGNSVVNHPRSYASR